LFSPVPRRTCGRCALNSSANHYIILSKLLEPELLATILKRIDSAPSASTDDGITRQSVVDDPLTYNLFLFLLCIPEFQGLVQRITGCRRISNFVGRIYRLNPTNGDHIVWHGDVSNHRLLAFSLNLTPQMYSGGALQIRNRGSKEILHEVRNTGLGDALLFRVANNLEHRVLPVEGNVPRTAMAGWFRWEKGNENHHAALRRVSSASQPEQAIVASKSAARAARRE
jgi:hypothetical protein